jgi:hypothetical protein
MSNSEQVKGNWNELKGKLKQKFAELTKTITYKEEKTRKNLRRSKNINNDTK